MPLSGSTLKTRARQYMVSNTHVVSPTKVNEFRFGANVMYNELGNELGGVRNVVEELGLPLGTEPPASWGIPTINVQRFSGFDNSVNGPFVIDDRIYQFVDNFSWVRGKHSPPARTGLRTYPWNRRQYAGTRIRPEVRLLAAISSSPLIGFR